MNSSENIDTQRIGKGLAILRQKVEAVLKIAPNLMEINSLDEFPKEKAKVVEDHLWSIFAYGEYYVEKLMSDQVAPMLSVKSKKMYDWHKNTYKPFSKKINELLITLWVPTRKETEIEILRYEYQRRTKEKLLKAGRYTVGDEFYPWPISQHEIEKHMDFYETWVLRVLPLELPMRLKTFNEKSSDLSEESAKQILPNSEARHSSSKKNKTIKDSLEVVMNVFEQHCNDIYDVSYCDETVSDCNKFMNKPYFNPDEWVANEEKLSPIFVTQEMERIPKHIQTRIHEIYHSFIFGNWMSAIALSRCLLEYALIHRKSLLEKRLDKKIEIRNENGNTKRISELASIAGEAFPELKDSMETVIQYGNYVMHPFRKTIPSKNLAKHCFEEINKIISTLYST